MPAPNLSKRELEVIRTLGELTLGPPKHKAIADKLCISVETVKHHLTHIFDKTGCDSKSDLLEWAIVNRLITIETKPKE